MLVHIYSLGYMEKDEGRPRYFAALSLFMFSMTGIVVADNLIMMFVFWELVGLSSYLLIGHWFRKPEAADAAKKAFITNRIGDFGFMTGILLLFGTCGQLSFSALRGLVSEGSLNHWIHQNPTLITVIALGLFLGAVGKSAQVPLHVWLPDAMEGPTPISALIHAATMVAAGVYMLARIHFLIATSATACTIIMWVGIITALLAALMAIQQNDIKKVLAYSTLSQLGYMVSAMGMYSPDTGMFHLYTHAFFKALLFLGAGAVIHCCHHEQDMWQLGGLKRRMPVTYWTFVIGTLALMGFPLTSGYFSKECILTVAYQSNHRMVFLFGALTALLTSFYMTRLVIVTFFGKPRSESAGHAHEAPMVMLTPLVILAVFSLISPLLTTPLQAMKPEEAYEWIVQAVSILVLLLGASAGYFFYWNKDSDPIKIPLLARKFYFDEFYAGLVKYAQDRVAWIVNALEKVFVDGLTTRLPAALARLFGNWFRGLQTGSLQGYSFLFGAGVIAAIYLTVFYTQKH
jgi:NADH-quinone oxidoreductase subunit L